MILKTKNSVYEVDTDAKRFRRVGGGTATLGHWHDFEYMSPVRRGERVRFSWIADEQGRAARISFVDTSPVTAVA